MSDDLYALSAAELVARYRDRSLSPVEVAKSVFRRIAAVNEPVNAFVLLCEEEALASAKASEARWRKGAPAGPIDGVPTTIKDLLQMKGHPTRKGSLTAPDTPTEGSPAPDQLAASGAVIVGKTTTPEFGWAGVTHSRLSGITRNPWDTSKTSGGSSGGAAAAAALGMGALHLGTDGAGSIRMPSSFCGTFGLKPTAGRVPYAPISAVGACSCIGPMTRTVTDAALMMNTMTAFDPVDWNAVIPKAPNYLDGLEAGVRGLRIAYGPNLFGARIDPEVAESVRKAVRVLEKLGAKVEEVGETFANPRQPFEAFYFASLSKGYRSLSAAQREMLDPGYRRYAEKGMEVSLGDYLAAETYQAALGAEVATFLQDYELILTPQLALTAFEAGVEFPEGRGMTRWLDWSPLTYPFNFTGNPAASVPCGFDSNGLPISFQLVAKKHDDALILRAARAYESAHPFKMPAAPNPKKR